MNTLEPIVINTSGISLTMSCEDIYEALRFCAIEKKCTRCPLFSITDCDAVLMPAVFEIVKRQKSEIEGLRACISMLEAAKNGAVDTFIRKLEFKLANNRNISAVGYQSIIADIHSVVKEMTEDNNA